VTPSPVAAKMIVWLGSLLRPKTAMLPMFRLVPGPKSVSGIQVGCPLGLRKSEVFQTPPEAPAAYTVLPDGSEGSTARPLTRPELPLSFSAAGPTAVHVSWDCTLAGSSVKMRKLTLAWSATGSPSPVPSPALGNCNDQFVSLPWLLPVFVIDRVQV